MEASFGQETGTPTGFCPRLLPPTSYLLPPHIFVPTTAAAKLNEFVTVLYENTTM
jgi:hypothetical protein